MRAPLRCQLPCAAHRPRARLLRRAQAPRGWGSAPASLTRPPFLLTATCSGLSLDATVMSESESESCPSSMSPASNAIFPMRGAQVPRILPVSHDEHFRRVKASTSGGSGRGLPAGWEEDFRRGGCRELREAAGAECAEPLPTRVSEFPVAPAPFFHTLWEPHCVHRRGRPEVLPPPAPPRLDALGLRSASTLSLRLPLCAWLQGPPFRSGGSRRSVLSGPSARPALRHGGRSLVVWACGCRRPCPELPALLSCPSGTILRFPGWTPFA